MKAVFGVISLLVVLAIVGVLASRQLKATTAVTPMAASAAAAASVVLPAASGGTPAEQSKQVQDQVLNDVMKAMQQGADADKKEPQ